MTHAGTARTGALICAAAASACALASSPAAIDAVDRATGAALQADATAAIAALNAVPSSEFTDPERSFRACMLERFGTRAPSQPPVASPHRFVRDVIEAYRTYWQAALRVPAGRDEVERRLNASLRLILDRKDLPDDDAVEAETSARLTALGLHSLLGRTGLLREFMLWEREERRLFDVRLLDEKHAMRVVLVDGLLSAGWGSYATCDRRGTGGWAGENVIHAVVPRYKSLESEEFVVTFLAHETQHAADLARFPGLLPWELEYRAKLIELSQADATRSRILQKFGEDQGDDAASAHSYANRRVIRSLSVRLALTGGESLSTVDVGRLQAAAAAELRDDTLRRAKASTAGAKPDH
jgi:hypothetical protein